MKCERCGGALTDEADRCWCSHGRLAETALREAAEAVLQDTRRELIGDALATVEAVARHDVGALAFLTSVSDQSVTTLILAALVLQLLGSLAEWNRREGGDLMADLRASLLG